MTLYTKFHVHRICTSQLPPESQILPHFALQTAFSSHSRLRQLHGMKPNLHKARKCERYPIWYYNYHRAQISLGFTLWPTVSSYRPFDTTALITKLPCKALGNGPLTFRLVSPTSKTRRQDTDSMVSVRGRKGALLSEACSSIHKATE